jgi:effector-binding domain-containing protein
MVFAGQDPAKIWMESLADEKGAKVSWNMYFKIGFLHRGIMLFMNMDKMAGTMFEEGLAKLKAELESMPKETAVAALTVNEMAWPEKNYFGKKTKMKVMESDGFLGENFPKIKADFEKNKIEMDGSPSGLYWNFDEQTMMADVGAAFAAKNAPKELKGWEKFTVPAGTAYYIDYFGGYKSVKAVHDALTKHVTAKGLKQSVVIEEYITDPGMEKDSMKWETKIYYIVK